ncbi:helix-turn-helix domain-containing protein [Falsirhodobacter sp. 20TX0035]|uniref:helix-turn-helix domain-containing protein n=1 Tax=Falsirhodobacter sp. 20TX0035 TaxID=3022019 RepID=UPI00232BE9C8|nr:helix-turn-helix transcriptional regulator [Falsirhodobacter sp. 20TX0035]MDB6454472.1 helix-turn-helix transcriptional regulator [Falsirhodobacter sp. 20TX0035]
MIELSRYLDENGLSQRAFAALIGCSPSYLSEILKGSKRPGLELAVAIQRETARLITVEMWVPESHRNMITQGDAA